MGATIEAEATEAAMMGATVTETAAAATAVRANSEPGAVRRRRADRLRPSAARTRIIGWVLLLVFTALGLVTFVTWRLLIAATDARMQQELRFEMQQFAELTAPGVNPRTGMPFASVDEVIREAIAYNVARPNEKFLGYVDGQYRVQSRPQVDGRATLAGDVDFSERVASITDPARCAYRHPQLGEVVYAAVPVTLTEDPARGVIVAAYLADAERSDADAAARLMLIVGAVTLLARLAPHGWWRDGFCVRYGISPKQRGPLPKPICRSASRAVAVTATNSATW